LDVGKEQIPMMFVVLGRANGLAEEDFFNNCKAGIGSLDLIPTFSAKRLTGVANVEAGEISVVEGFDETT
jgi:hypothetical protein